MAQIISAMKTNRTLDILTYESNSLEFFKNRILGLIEDAFYTIFDTTLYSILAFY